jgi:DNA (cytosine-5)-methyltransferase 1
MLRVIQEAKPNWIIGENVAGIVNLALDQVCADLEGQGYEVEPIIVPACAVDAPHRRDRVWIVGHSKLNGLTASKTSGGLLDQSEEQRGKVKEWESSGASCTSSDVADSVSLSERSAHGSKEWGCVRGRKDEDISQRNEMGSNSSDSRENVADTNSGLGKAQYGESLLGKQNEQGKTNGHTNGCLSEGAIWLAEPNVGRVANGIPNRSHRLKGLGNAIVPQVASEIIRCINKIMKDNK